MSRTLLHLTDNTPAQFNIDYAHTRDRDFLGIIAFELNADEQMQDENLANEYFKYINLRAFPRILDQFINDSPLERELSLDDRVKEHLLVIDQGEEPRSFQVFARWSKGSRADYISTLCCNLSNEMRFNMMDEEARNEHYVNSMLKEYDGKIIRDWEIARYIEDRDRWWTRKNLDRYISDHTMLIRPRPELLKGDYATEEEMMFLSAPPVAAATDYSSDAGTDDERVPVSAKPSPVKVQDIIDLRQSKESEMADKQRREELAREKAKNKDDTKSTADARHLAKAAANARQLLKETYPGAASSSSNGSVSTDQQPATEAADQDDPPPEDDGNNDGQKSDDESSQNEDSNKDKSSNGSGTDGNGSGNQSGSHDGNGSGGDDNPDDPPDGDDKEEGDSDEEEAEEEEAEEEEEIEEDSAPEDADNTDTTSDVVVDEEVSFSPNEDQSTDEDDRDGSSSSSEEDDADDENVPVVSSVGLYDQIVDLKTEMTNKLTTTNFAEGFSKPEVLHARHFPKDPYNMHQYVAMNELMEFMPSMIIANAKQDVRMQFVESALVLMAKQVDFISSKISNRDQTNNTTLRVVRDTKKVIDSMNERQIHAQGIDRVATVSRQERKKNDKRQKLKDKLLDEVFPINRVTKAVMELFKSPGFQRAAAEMVAADLPYHDKTSLRANFNTVLFEKLFTRRCFSFFYIGANACHNTADFTVPMPPQMQKIKRLVWEICGFDAQTKDALEIGFKRKCTDTRTYRRKALRKAFKPTQKKAAETYIYNDLVKFTEDHTWWRQKNGIDRDLPTLAQFLKDSRYKSKADDLYRHKKDKEYWKEKPNQERDLDYCQALAKDLDRAYSDEDRKSSDRASPGKRPRDDDGGEGPSKRRKDQDKSSRSKDRKSRGGKESSGGKDSSSKRTPKDKGKGKKSKTKDKDHSHSRRGSRERTPSTNGKRTPSHKTPSKNGKRTPTIIVPLPGSSTGDNFSLNRHDNSKKKGHDNSKGRRREEKQRKDAERWKVANTLFQPSKTNVDGGVTAVPLPRSLSIADFGDIEFPPTQLCSRPKTHKKDLVKSSKKSSGSKQSSNARDNDSNTDKVLMPPPKQLPKKKKTNVSENKDQREKRHDDKNEQSDNTDKPKEDTVLMMMRLQPPFKNTTRKRIK